MFRDKRGQAATEYLVTYSWAFVVILGAIGTLIYFDAFNPDKYMPDECEFGEQLKCVDWFLGASDTEAPVMVLRFRNNFEQDIQLVNISGKGLHDWNEPSFTIEAGKIIRVDMTASKDIFVDERETFEMTVVFRRYDAESPAEPPLHNLSGRVSSVVGDNSLGLV